MIVVSDTTPLSNLLQIDKLNLLKQLYKKLIIPPAVFDELSVLESIGVSIKPIEDAEWISIVSPKNRSKVEELLKHLDRGEAEAIALAIEVDIEYFLIDEKQGRIIAEQMDLPIIGTLGSLLKAKQKGFVVSVKTEMIKLREIGFWINDSLFQRMLKLANEN